MPAMTHFVEVFVVVFAIFTKSIAKEGCLRKYFVTSAQLEPPKVRIDPCLVPLSVKHFIRRKR